MWNLVYQPLAQFSNRFEICTEHSSILVVLCANFQNDLKTRIDVLDERDFIRFEFSKLQGLYSLSGKMSYRKISWSFEATGFGFRLFQSLRKVDSRIGSTTAEIPAQFQSDAIIITSNLAAWRLHEIWRYDVLPLSE